MTVEETLHSEVTASDIAKNLLKLRRDGQLDITQRQIAEVCSTADCEYSQAWVSQQLHHMVNNE